MPPDYFTRERMIKVAIKSVDRLLCTTIDGDDGSAVCLYGEPTRWPTPTITIDASHLGSPSPLVCRSLCCSAADAVVKPRASSFSAENRVAR